MLNFKEKSISASLALILFSLVFIAVPIGYLNILFSQLGSTIEPFFILLICTLLVILIAISKMPLSVNKAEMYYLLFISYIVIKNILANSFDVSSIVIFI